MIKKIILSISILFVILFYCNYALADQPGANFWTYNFSTGLLYLKDSINQLLIGGNTPQTNALLEVQGDINVTSGNDVCIDGGACLSTGGGGGGLSEITSVGDGTSLVADGSQGYIKSVVSSTLLDVTDNGNDITLTVSSSPTFGSVHATSGTSTITNLSVTSVISILGEYITNFTNYVRSLFTGGKGINISAGEITIDEAVDANWSGTHTFANPPVSTQQATTSLQLVNKQQLDTVATGYILKESVVAATTGAITTSTEQTIDGVSVVTGDRVLVKNQAQAWRNGIYVVSTGDWTRATDYDETSEVKAGTFCNVLMGTANGLKSFAQINIDPTINVDALTFTQLSASNVYNSANGISESSNVFSLGGTLIQNTSINQANYSFDFNLNGTGDFNVTDNGTPALTVDDSGKTTITNLVAGWLSATTSLDYWFNSSSTIKNIDLAGSSATGVLPITKGGTGKITANDALNALLPSQTGNTGKVLGSDGTNASWVTASSGDGASVTSTFANVKRLDWVANGAAYSTWTNMPTSSANFLMGSTTPESGTQYYKKFDLTNAFRFRTSRSLSVAGYAGSYIWLQYSTDRVNWYDAGTNDDCTLVGTGQIPCPWETLAVGARTDVYLRYRGFGGNDVIDPRFYSLTTEFAEYSSTEEDNATSTSNVVFVTSPTANQTWSNIPLLRSGTYYNGFGSVYHYQAATLYKVNKYRIVHTLVTSTNSVNNPISTMRIDAQYSYDKTNWFNLNSGVASPATSTGEVDISQNVNQTNYGNWVDVAEGGKGAVWLRFVGYGGNGTNDMLFRNLEIQFESDLVADFFDNNWEVSGGVLTPTTTIPITVSGVSSTYASTSYSIISTALTLFGQLITSFSELASNLTHNLLTGKQGGDGTNYYHSDQPINTTSSPSFSGLQVNGNSTTTGYSSLATTTMAFDSMVGNSNTNITFADFVMPTGGFLEGYKFPTIIGMDSQSPLTGLFTHNYFGILGSSDNGNSLVFLSTTTNRGAVIGYGDDSNYLLLSGIYSGLSNTYSQDLDNVILNSEELSLLSNSNNTALSFYVNDESISIAIESSTDRLLLSDADGGYDFEFGIDTEHISLTSYQFTDSSFLNNSKMAMISGYGYLSGTVLDNNAVIYGRTYDDNPKLLFGHESSTDLFVTTFIALDATTNAVYNNIIDSSGNLDSVLNYLIGTDYLTVASDNNPSLKFSDILGNLNGVIITYNTTTNVLSFNDATNYIFDDIVGIGTSTPSAQLDVYMASSTNLISQWVNDVGATIKFYANKIANFWNTLYINGNTNQVAVATTTPATGFALTVDGYANYRGIYAEIYSYEEPNASTTVTTAGTYYPITVWTNGISSGNDYATTSATGKIGIGKKGIYRVEHQASFSSNKVSDLHADVWVNGADVEKCAWRRDITLANNNGSAGATCLLSLNANDELEIRATSNDNNTVISWDHLNLNVNFISNQ